MIFDLVKDFADVLDAMPQRHPRRRILKLLDEAIRRDVHFIARHAEDYPQALFQCLWNSCWWYDCPEASEYYLPPESGLSECAPPWAQSGPKLYELLESWRVVKEKSSLRFRWLRSLRPPELQLNAAIETILSGHDAAVNAVEFSANGSSIFSGSSDKSVRTWNTISGAAEEGGTQSLGASVRCIALSPDGTRIVAGVANDVVLLDCATGRRLARMRGHMNVVSGVRFSRDGKHIVSCSWDGTVRVWKADDWSEIRLMTCTCNRDGESSASDRAESTTDFREVILGGSGGVRCIDLGPNDRTLVCGTDNGLQIWDWEQGNLINVLCREVSPVHAVAFSPQGDRIASGHADTSSSLRIWNAATGAEAVCIHGHDDFVRSVAFSADGSQLASGSKDNTVRLWDSETGAALDTFRGHRNQVESVTFSPDNQRVASASQDRTVIIWDVKSEYQPRQLIGHSNEIEAIELTSDGEWLATGAQNTIRLWSTNDGRQINGINNDFEVMKFLPNSRRLALGKGTVAVCDCANMMITRNGKRSTLQDIGAAFREKRNSKRNALLARFARVGIVVAVCSTGELIGTAKSHNNRYIEIWDATTCMTLKSLPRDIDVSSITFSPDGAALAFGSCSGDVYVWDWVVEVDEVIKLEGHKDKVNCMAFSPDGRFLASGSADGTLRIWHIATRSSCARLPVPCRCKEIHAFLDLSFTPDGRSIIAREGQGAVRDWVVPYGPWREWAVGHGDVHGIARYRTTSRWWALNLGSETEVRSPQTSRTAAWYPHPISKIVSLPSGASWAGATGSHLQIVTLEGPSRFRLADNEESNCEFCGQTCSGPWLTWNGRSAVGAACIVRIMESSNGNEATQAEAGSLCELCRMPVMSSSISTPCGPICASCFEQAFEIIIASEDVSSWTNVRLEMALSPEGCLRDRFAVLTRFDEVIHDSWDSVLADRIERLLVANLGFDADHAMSETIRLRAQAACIETGARLIPLLLEADLSTSPQWRANAVLVAGLLASEDERVRALLHRAISDPEAEIRKAVLRSLWGNESDWAAETVQSMTDDVDPYVREFACILCRKMKEANRYSTRL